jgi:hypothetical protein
MIKNELMVSYPDASTLPTAERPFRLAEWDQLLSAAVLDARRLSPDRARLKLRADPEMAALPADLAFRETQCCSFFGFSQHARDGRLALEITVPTAQIRVLDALVALASSDRKEDLAVSS